VLAVGLWLRFDTRTAGLFDGPDSPTVFFTGEAVGTTQDLHMHLRHISPARTAVFSRTAVTLPTTALFIVIHSYYNKASLCSTTFLSC